MQSLGAMPLPTVREVLQVSEIAAAAPEVLSGHAALSNPVRWVHVLESTDVENLLQGHELILTTGVAWPAADRELVALARAFARSNTSAIILELGTRFANPPAAFVAACRDLGVPFVVLHTQVKFVLVTEKVHQEIISTQHAALRAKQEISKDVTEMIARGAEAEHLLSYAATELARPIVLQDPARKVLDLFGVSKNASWWLTHLAQHPSQWHQERIMANNQLWGYLLAPSDAVESLSEVEPPVLASLGAHPASVEFVLGQVSLALAVGRLAALEGRNSWRALRDRRLISKLVSGNYSQAEDVESWLASLGLSLERGAVGVSIQIDANHELRSSDWLAEQLEVAGLKCAVAQIKVAERSLEDGSNYVALLVLDTHSVAEAIELAHSAIQRFWPGARLTVGDAGSGADEVGRSLRSAADMLAIPNVPEVPGVPDVPDVHSEQPEVLYASDHRLQLLIRGMRSRPELAEYVEQTLGVLSSWDQEHNGDLLEVLRAYLKTPTNRSAAAALSHVSRSVFYQRLALIEELLGADLNSGETISSLHSAMIAYDALK